MDANTEIDASPITPAQIRAARALLDWTRQEAARFCGIGVNTLGRFENGERTPATRILNDVARVFEEHGIIFVTERSMQGVLLSQDKSGIE